MAEIEAKFLLERREQLDEVLDELARLGHKVQKGPTESIVDRYFDTADRLVFRAGWTYRLRQTGERHKLTLKALTRGAGPVFIREEIDQPLQGDERVGLTLPPGPVQQRLEPIVNGHARRELFRVRNRRTLYTVTAPDPAGTSIELALDSAEISADGASSRPLSFLELELELSQGDAHAVEHIANILVRRVGLVSARLSKFERGLQAAGIEYLSGSTAISSDKTDPESPLLALAYAYIGRHHRSLERHQYRAWEGLDSEGVHQMRIALRRQRAGLRVFRDVLPKKKIKHFNREFRWLLTALGEMRDADVHWENLQPYLAALPERDADAVEPFAQHLHGVQHEARASLLRVLGSDRYRQLMLNLEEFVVKGPSAKRRHRFANLTVDSRADTAVSQSLAKVLKQGRRIDDAAPDDQVHRLRILVKRCRYLIDIFAASYPGKFKRLRKACRKLQNELGEHQDAVVAIQLMSDFAASVGLNECARNELVALGRLMQRQTDRRDRIRNQFRALWEEFEQVAASL